MNCDADELKRAAGHYLATEEIIFSTNSSSKTVAGLVRESGFQISVVKPKPNSSLWPISEDIDNPVNQSKSTQVHADGIKCGKPCMSESR